MNYYTQKCMEEFSKKRQKIIVSVAKMTRQTLENSIADAWILNEIESDVEFKKQLNKQLKKNFLGDIKCGATCNFMHRFEDGLDDGEEVLKGHHSGTLDVLIGLEVGLAGLGRNVKVDTKSLAIDLGVTERHALRIKNCQAKIEQVQAGLFDDEGEEE